jgi:hypothetical protein
MIMNDDEDYLDGSYHKITYDYVLHKPFNFREKRKITFAMLRLEKLYGHHYGFEEQLSAGMREGQFNNKKRLTKKDS